MEPNLPAAIATRPNGMCCFNKFVRGGLDRKGSRAKHISKIFIVHEIEDSGEDDGHFDLIETTVSHLFREPNEALNGLTYGRLLMQQLRRLGWFNPKPHVIVEVGGGLGYVARDLGKELLPFEKQNITIHFSRYHQTLPQAASIPRQIRRLERAAAHSANGEWLPFKDNSVDLVIDNENMADMTPVKLTRNEFFRGTGDTATTSGSIGLDQARALPMGMDLPEDVIFNLGPFRFIAELWRVFKPGGQGVPDRIRDRRRLACAGQTARPYRI